MTQFDIANLDMLSQQFLHNEILAASMERLDKRAHKINPPQIAGKVVEAVGTVVKVALQGVGIGDLCEFRSLEGKTVCFGEVVGFLGELALVTILGESQGISAQTQVIPAAASQGAPVCRSLLGRVLDGMGRLIDNGPPLAGEIDFYPIYNVPPEPLDRRLIEKPFPLRIRVLDGLLTVGEGQRLGIFAAAGGGKSTLLSSLVKGAQCDVRVVALIGERGREVREFVEHALGKEAMEKTVLVVSTSDRSSLERARAAYLATAIAEYFRDKGQSVLLLMDSITRFARALREIGLAAGEPPARLGFPPSVFATLPRLLERSGMGKQGSITALYTVLVEGDDMTEPIADEVRSILDGHIILSRALAAANHYPAIDVLASTSRTMNLVTTKEQQQHAGIMRRLMAAYKKSELLIKIGEYQKGSDPDLDKAIEKQKSIEGFLVQGLDEFSDYEETLQQMKGIAQGVV